MALVLGCSNTASVVGRVFCNKSA